MNLKITGLAAATVLFATTLSAQDYSLPIDTGTAGFRLQNQQLTFQIAVEGASGRVELAGQEIDALFREDGHAAGTVTWNGGALDGATLDIDGVRLGTLVRTGAGTGGGGGGGEEPPVDTSPCAAGAGCVLGDRFEIVVEASGPAGALPVTAVQLTDETVYFTFLSSDNVEVFAKVPTGSCGVNDRFWFFAGGATDLDVTLTVRDTRSGGVKQYTSTGPFTAINDTDAFATCDQ